MKKFNVFLMGDQPTTCPKCGARTEIIKHLFNLPSKTQYHKCLSNDCKYTFIVEDDN